MGLHEPPTSEGLNDAHTAHHGDVYVEDWERFAAGDSSDPLGYWNFENGTVDNTNVYGGSRTLNLDVPTPTPSPIISSPTDGGYPRIVQHVYYETTNSSGHLVGPADEDGAPFCAGGSNNPEVHIYDANGYEDLYTPTNSYQEFRRVTLTIDWDGGTFDFLWEDLTGGEPNQQVTGRPLAQRVPNYCAAIEVEASGGGDGTPRPWLDNITGFQEQD